MEVPKKSYKEEVKFMLILMAFLASALCNYFMLVGSVRSNTYRIEQIEQDRADKWARYEDCCEERDKLLKVLGEDMAVIKSKIEVMHDVMMP